MSRADVEGPPTQDRVLGEPGGLVDHGGRRGGVRQRSLNIVRKKLLNPKLFRCR